jgi:hypothetical protein
MLEKKAGSRGAVHIVGGAYDVTGITSKTGGIITSLGDVKKQMEERESLSFTL